MPNDRLSVLSRSAVLARALRFGAAKRLSDAASPARKTRRYRGSADALVHAQRQLLSGQSQGNLTISGENEKLNLK